jgi:sulfane dehydrogenase subunit SoxC
MSRATDETGATQPTRGVFAATRGPGTDYHFNYIQAWNVAGDGRVTFAV